MPLKPDGIAIVKRQLLNYLIAFESVLLVCLTVVAAQVRHVGVDFTYRNDFKENVLLFTFPIIWLCCLSLFGAWDTRILDDHIDGYRRLMKSSFMTFLTFSSASYLFKIQISRFVILLSLVGGTILHLILRWIFLRIVENRLRERNSGNRWLVLNRNAQGNSFVEQFATQNFAQIEYFELYHEEDDFLAWVKEVIRRISVDNFDKLIVVSIDGFKPNQIENLMWAVQQTDTEFVVRDNLGLATSQSEIRYFEDLNWISIGTPQINDSLRVLKRTFDLVLVIPVFIILIPLYTLIALLLKLDSRGNILYTQTRIGQNGVLFRFPKFRSMKPNAEAMRLEILGRPDDDMATRYKNDPRITRFGRFLRRYSLDELPQLWCVLIGTMSLVGPRPILPEEEEQLGEFHFRRHIAKPGLTGIWQVSGRKDTTWEERMAFDVKYVQEWSLALDLILIARTFKVIISGKGSY